MPLSLSLTPECRLVFAAAHVAPDAAAIAELARQPLDWGRVIAIAEMERATSPLWRVIERSFAGTVARGDGDNHAGGLLPRAAAEHLRRSAMVSDFRMLRLGARLQATLAALRERDVPVLLLKGAAMASSFHDGFTDRPMTDVDLLVHRADVPRAREAIIESGWPETTDPVLLSLLKDQHHLPHFVDPEPTGLRIELHTMLLPPDQPFVLDAERPWATARPAAAPFGNALVAEPHFLLLHACLHFAWSHTMRFGAWRTFRDASALVRSPAFNWDDFVALARETKGLTSCYWTLRLARRLSGVDVPPEVMRALAPPTSERVCRGLERHFISAIAPGEAPPCPSVKIARMLWLAALRPRWSGHADAGRIDPEHRWERARGTASTETLPQRVARHTRGIRYWWDFAARTLFTLSPPRPRGTPTPQ